MADANDKANSNNSSAGPETKVEGGELSLDDLDKVISESDPEFAASMSEVANEKLEIEIADDSDFEYTFALEERAWAQKTGLAGKLYKIFPGIARIAYLYNLYRPKLILKIRSRRESTIAFLLALPQWSKQKIGAISGSIKQGLDVFSNNFRSRSTLGKLGLVGILLGSIASLIGAVFLIRGLIPPPPDLFINSLDEWAEHEVIYDRNTEVESFYDSTRAMQNVYALAKVVVNIRPSKSSGENPMAAMEFIFEGNSSESVIEVKDREPELRDLVQRVLEEMTFDQLASSEGKQQVNDTLRKAVNRVLTQGKIRRVYIKTAIVKP